MQLTPVLTFSQRELQCAGNEIRADAKLLVLLFLDIAELTMNDHFVSFWPNPGGKVTVTVTVYGWARGEYNVLGEIVHPSESESAIRY